MGYFKKFVFLFVFFIGANNANASTSELIGVIGAAIGANEAEKNSTTTAMVCKTETRKKSTTVNEYSHSTISFAYDGIMYEVDFIKKQ